MVLFPKYLIWGDVRDTDRRHSLRVLNWLTTTIRGRCYELRFLAGRCCCPNTFTVSGLTRVSSTFSNAILSSESSIWAIWTRRRRLGYLHVARIASLKRSKWAAALFVREKGTSRLCNTFPSIIHNGTESFQAAKRMPGLRNYKMQISLCPVRTQSDNLNSPYLEVL